MNAVVERRRPAHSGRRIRGKGHITPEPLRGASLGQDQELPINSAISLDESITKTIRQGLPGDNTSSRADLDGLYKPWNDTRHTYWSDKKVIGEALYAPDLKKGSQRVSLVRKNIEDQFPSCGRS